MLHIEIDKEIIYPVLSQIQSLLEKRINLPVFMNILIKTTDTNQIKIQASDTELSFLATLPAKIIKPGCLVIKGKKIFEIVRELSFNTFKIEAQKNNVIYIEQHNSIFKIPSLDFQDYPKIGELDKKESHKILVADFLDVIDKTLFCASLDESRYHLTGIFLEQIDSNFLRFVATDGHRLSYIDVKKNTKLNLKEGIIIPKKALIEAKKMFSQAKLGDFLEIYIEKPKMLIVFKNQSLNIRLIEGQYPDYKKLILKQKYLEASIKQELFLQALKRISVLTTVRLKGVEFIFKKKSLSMRFSNPDEGEASEEIPCVFQGDKDLKIKFNARYIVDILQSIHDKDLIFSLKNSESSGLIKGKKIKNYTYLVMPMRL